MKVDSALYYFEKASIDFKKQAIFDFFKCVFH
jgi:hypothetical protein